MAFVPPTPSRQPRFPRENLDPHNVKTDEELWTACEIALIKEAVSEMPDGLDTHVCDDGKSSFSGSKI